MIYIVKLEGLERVKEVIIPIESKKKEAPYMIEMLWIIKVQI